MRGRVGMTLGAAGLLGLILTLALTMGAKEDEPDAAPSAIAKEQVEYAQAALKSLSRQVDVAERRPADPEIRKWARRLVEAERAAGDPEAYRKASEDYLELMKKNVQMTEGQFRVGKITPLELMDVKYELNEARLWLARDRQDVKP